MSAPATNILIIHVDQWRWDALGCLGSPAKTPNLDALAARGVHFDHAFVQSPVCMPSRVSMLTGRYPSDLGITHMGVPVPEATETLATVLGRRGWRTANIGKLHFQPHANRDHASPHPSYGFDELALSDEPGVYEDDYRAWVRSVDPSALDSLSLGLPPAAEVWQSTLGIEGDIHHDATGPRDDFAGARTFEGPSQLTHSAWVATRSIQHLEGLDPQQPALTIASFFSPHAPFHVPQEFLDLYNRDNLPLPDLTDAERAAQPDSGISDAQIRAVRHGYFAAISEVDHHVGRILAALDNLGRAENTFVVFISDHGEWLGDHLRFAKGYPADDAVSRVPLIMAWPAGIDNPGRLVSRIVEAIDVVPTVLDAAGIPTPYPVQGRSLYAHLATSGDANRRQESSEIGITEHHGWRSIRTPGCRYIVHADGSEHLWKVDEDPSSEEEVADNREALLMEHRMLYIQRMLQAERPLPRTWAY